MDNKYLINKLIAVTTLLCAAAVACGGRGLPSPTPPAYLPDTPQAHWDLDSLLSSSAFDESLADQQLRLDTLRIIAGYTGDDCQMSVDDVDVVQPLDANGIWIEEWVLTACNETTTYRITFTLSPSGGTDIVVSPQ